MSGFHDIVVAGRLSRDPELKTFDGGSCVCKFSIPVSKKYKGEETTYWHNVVCWNKTAENCAQYLQKGDIVLVKGEPRENSWEKDGVTHTRVELNAFTVQFLHTQGKEGKQQELGGNVGGGMDDSEIPF